MTRPPFGFGPADRPDDPEGEGSGNDPFGLAGMLGSDLFGQLSQLMAWRGGPVSGIIAPDRKTRMRLVAATAPPGLDPSAPPSIDQIPNNHRSYAVQWFLFALIAAVIYGLALRKKLKDEASKK